MNAEEVKAKAKDIVDSVGEGHLLDIADVAQWALNALEIIEKIATTPIRQFCDDDWCIEMCRNFLAGKVTE